MKCKTTIRKWVQLLFLVITVSIGIKFYLFVSGMEGGWVPAFDRPPGVEAFLPISALVGLKHFFLTGTINGIHPSALVLLLIICATALVAKKGFCSWVCPIGFLSDGLSRLHRRFFKKAVTVPPWIDVPLRGIKYLLAGFFIYQIFFKMPANSVEQFIQSPYNRFADVTMLHFFTRISTTALIVLLVLVILSVVIHYFWCRYLCPYGTLLSVIGLFSRGHIKRNPDHCTDCGRCEKECPGRIKIRQKERIHSPECTACMSCIETCPEKKAVVFSFLPGTRHIRPWFPGVIFIMMFAVGITIANLTGHWRNDISKQEYFRHINRQPMPWIHRKRIDPATMERMMERMRRTGANSNEEALEQ